VTLSEFLAKTSTLQHLTLRGLGMTDEAFDKIVRDGIGTLTLSLKLMNSMFEIYGLIYKD
jgi:hypothetical protein